MQYRLALILLYALTSWASAQELCPSEGSILSNEQRGIATDIEPRTGMTKSAELLSSFVLSGCFGGALDVDPFSQRMLGKISAARSEQTDHLVKKRKVEEMLSELATHAVQQTTNVQFVETSQVWTSLVHQLNVLQSTLDASRVDFTVYKDDLKTNVLNTYDGMALVSQQCPQLWKEERCIQSVKETGALFRAVVLAQDVVSVANLQLLNSQLSVIKTRLEGYKNYYEKAEPLWPWEHYINKDIVTSKDVVVRGNLQGFRDPVEYQLLFLHPTTALQYVNDQEAKMKPAVIVDVLGYNVLDWEKNGGDLSSYGGSAIIALSEFEGKTNVGWGFRVFYNKTYSFGITKNSDQIGLFFSVGAIEKFNGWGNKKDDFIEEYNHLLEQFRD